MRGEQQSTPVRRICPVCGERASDLEYQNIVVMCGSCRRACRLALKRAGRACWDMSTYVEWLLARARRVTARRHREMFQAWL
jgi:hypothetical protein